METNQDRSIELTNSALGRITNVLKEGERSKFRVYVTGGGCSGFQYGFKFDDVEAFDDDVIDFGEFSKVFLLFVGADWPEIEILFFETFIFVSFSVYSSSVRLNSSK